MTSLLPEYVVLTFSISNYESKLDQFELIVRWILIWDLINFTSLRPVIVLECRNRTAWGRSDVFDLNS